MPLAIPLMILNTVFALTTVGYAIAAIRSPNRWLGTTTATSGEHFYARVYAARAVPLGLCAAIAPFLGTGASTSIILAAAAIAQFADCAIGIFRKLPGMAIGGGIAAIIHLVCAIILL